MTATKKTTTKGDTKGKVEGSEAGIEGQSLSERFVLTPEQAAALVARWDTHGDESTGDLILLCRALVYSSPSQAEEILMAIEREKGLVITSARDALDQFVARRRAAWQKEVPR